MKDNHMFKNIIKATIVFLIAFAFIMPVSAALFDVTNKESEKLAGNSGIISNTIYVDDDNTEGPWDGSMEYPYQYIQDGIDAANPGDEIYVFNGTYHENIVVFTSTSLTGEDKDETIIEGGECCTVVTITANSVQLSGFTIKNSGDSVNHAGISINSQDNTITANNIVHNNYGIRTIEPNNIIFLNN